MQYRITTWTWIYLLIELTHPHVPRVCAIMSAVLYSVTCLGVKWHVNKCMFTHTMCVRSMHIYAHTLNIMKSNMCFTHARERKSQTRVLHYNARLVNIYYNIYDDGCIEMSSLVDQKKNVICCSIINRHSLNSPSPTPNIHVKMK